MAEAPILAHPDYDKQFILYTDASYSGLGFILAQKGEDEKEHVIAYGGRKLQSAEQNYTITELECLGVVWGVRKNKQFFGQNNFLLFTDHKALETLRKQALPSIPRRTRWILELEQYNYIIKHRPGKKMTHVDYLSRYGQEINAVTFKDKPEYAPESCYREEPTSAMRLNYASLRKQVKKSPNNNNNNMSTYDNMNTNDDPWEKYPEQSPTWSEASSQKSEPPSKWDERNFTHMGRLQQCQSREWNPKYHMESNLCQMEGHHTHYYCKYCKFCFNPNGWWKKPQETDQCRCNKLEDPDEDFYEQPWDPSYRPE